MKGRESGDDNTQRGKSASEFLEAKQSGERAAEPCGCVEHVKVMDLLKGEGRTAKREKIVENRLLVVNGGNAPKRRAL